MAEIDANPEERLLMVSRWHCEAVLAKCGGNVSEAARRLGINRKTLATKRKAWQAEDRASPRADAAGEQA